MLQPPLWLPGLRDAVHEVKGRLQCYRDDWRDGFAYSFRILAPSTWIFAASLLPALAFGQQLAEATQGQLTVVHVLISTAIAGVLQAVIGGQPLLIVGVAEPIVIIYSFLFQFADGNDGLGPELYLPWCAWVCVWTSLMCAAIALLGACRGVPLFTRMAGELFGLLIAVLFMQQAVKGLISEFRPEAAYLRGASDHEADEPSWILVNGVWALFLSCSLVACSLVIVHARRSRLGNTTVRGLVADYGVPGLVVAFSALSFALKHQGNPAGVPAGVPRRISTPLTWEINTWHIATRMSDVPSWAVAGALLPAVAITTLFWFDHGVSSQLAQPKELNLRRPPAYAWDMLLLAGNTLMLGLLGLPPINGVLPQSPMHTRALAALWRETKGKQALQGLDRSTLQHCRRTSGSTHGTEATRSTLSTTSATVSKNAVCCCGNQLAGAGPVTQPPSRPAPLLAANGPLLSKPQGTQLTPLEQRLPAVPAPPEVHQGSVAVQIVDLQHMPLAHQQQLTPVQPVRTSSPGRHEQQHSEQQELEQPAVLVPFPLLSPAYRSQEVNQIEEEARGPGFFFQTYEQRIPELQELADEAQADTEEVSGAGPFMATYLPPEQQQQPQFSGTLELAQRRSSSGRRGVRPDMEVAKVSAGEAHVSPRAPAVASLPPVPAPVEGPRQGSMGPSWCSGQPSSSIPSHPDALALVLDDKEPGLVLQPHNTEPRVEVAPGHPTEAAEMRYANGQPLQGPAPAEPSVGVAEQRLSNLVQSLLVAACLPVMYAIQQVPTSVVWGFFLVMGIDSLSGSQFWERLKLLLTDPKRRPHAAYTEGVPFPVVVLFTLLQFSLLAGVWAFVTWAGIAGVAFPLLIVSIIPLRMFILPRMFGPYLEKLDEREV